MPDYPCVESLVEFQEGCWYVRLWINRPASSPALPQQAAEDVVALVRMFLASAPVPPDMAELCDYLAGSVPACNAAQVTDLDAVPRQSVVLYVTW